ncbi:MAG: MFS transporter [Pseudomonadota bacterium]
MKGGRGTQPARFYYGWCVVGVAFLANFMSTGTSFYVFNAFLLPLCEARGWTRAEFNIAPMLGFICGLLAQFSYGSLLDRFGPRLLMTVGPLLSCAAFIMLGRVESLWIFHLCYVALQVGNSAMSGIVGNTAVSNWFEARRGRAIGIATMGISLSGVALPYLSMRLIAAEGIATAALCIGLSILIVAPLAWALVRTGPEECGLTLEGAAGMAGAAGGPVSDAPPYLPMSGPHADVPPGPELDARAVLARPDFWKLGLAYALGLMGAMGVMFQIAPRFQDLGLSGPWAMALTAAMALLGTIGKLAWGMFCDWWRPLKVVGLLFMLKAVGMALGLITGSMAATALFILVFGFAMGGVMSTYPILTAHLFGREGFTRVYRMLVLFLALQGFGYLVMGQSFTRTGSYDLAYACFFVLDLIAAGLIISLGRQHSPRLGAGRRY